MELQYLIIVFGFLAILSFIVGGFFSGKHNNSALVRDSRTENAAQELSPTINKISETVGSVGIVESDVPEVHTEQKSEEVSEVQDFNQTMKEQPNLDNESIVMHNESVDEKEIAAKPVKKSFWSRLKGLVAHKPKAKAEVFSEPQNQYFVSIKSKDSVGFVAKDVADICKQYMFQLRDMGVFYHENEGRTVFGICGNTEPYGFVDGSLDGVHYQILNIFMDLPDRGFAESNYVEMVSFAYILTQSLGGEMVNENSQPIDEEMVNKVRGVLSAYDCLA